MNTVGLFVDVPSIYFSVKRKFGEDMKVNYSQLLTTSLGPEDYLYTTNAYVLTHSNAQPTKFLAALRHGGYQVKQKTPRYIKKTTTTVVKNDNFDCQITLDVLNNLAHLSKIILCVNSEDMVPLVEHIRNIGKQVEIYCCGIPACLKNVATSYREFEDNILL